MGLPGSGKTTLAAALVERTGWAVVSRDEIRRAMFRPESLTLTEKQAAFGAVVLAVEALVAEGRSCVVEGMPFSRAGELEAVLDAAARHGAHTVPVFLSVPAEIAAERIERQHGAGERMAADRTRALPAEVEARFRAIPDYVTVVDGRRTPDQLAADVLASCGVGAVPC
jgi:predicted kinase